MDLVVKNCRLVTGEGIIETCMAVGKGKIIRFSKNPPKAAKVLDAKGNCILPGLIDAHVHFREPGASQKEDWFTGSSAAAAGGVTTVLDMPNTNPPTTTLKLLKEKRKLAEKSVVDFGFHFGASTENRKELEKVARIASVKFYMSTTTGSLLLNDDALMWDYFKIISRRNILATVHAEDEDTIQQLTDKLKNKGRNDPLAHCESRSGACALKAVERAMSMAEIAGNRLHICHVSTAKELFSIKNKKNKLGLTCEATPHHLFLTEYDLKKLGNFGKMNPPLRKDKDKTALWEAVHDETIDIIATDHAPHTKESKQGSVWNAPAGVPGVETMLPLLLNEVNKKNLTLQQITKLCSENPARIFGIKNKGKLAPGDDADFVIVDLKKEKKVVNDKLFTKCKWSPFNGLKLKGWPIKTFVRGQLVFDNGKVNKIKGREVEYKNE